MSKRSALDLGTIDKRAGKTHNPVDVLKHQKAGTSKSRDGRVQIQGFFLPAYRATLKMLAAKQGATVEGMLQEAMEDLFKKYKMKVS